MRDICSHDQCTGCNACINICAHSAIIQILDSDGYLYPKIDESKCIGCNACQSVCPSNNPPILNTALHSYVAYAKDKDEQRTSTSGGLASVLCRRFLQQGGVVYGCTSCDYPKIHHVRITDENELYRIKGSKYVQSDTETVFKEIKADLKSKKVIFIGTPCQCAGLRNYIRGMEANIILVDFVCHGVPSQQLLHDAIAAQGYAFNAKEVYFREKEPNGVSKYGLFVYDGNHNCLYKGYYPQDDFIVTFLSGLFYRQSCYACRYAQPQRCSDITLGDYWDIEKNSKMPKQRYGGMSMVIVNPQKGQKLFSYCAQDVIYEQSSLNVFVKINGQLHHPMKKPPFYDSYHIDYKDKNYKFVCSKYLPSEKNRIKRSQIKNLIRDIVYLIPGVKYIYKLLFQSK